MSPKSDGFKDFVLDQLTDLRGVTRSCYVRRLWSLSWSHVFRNHPQRPTVLQSHDATASRYKAHGMKPFRPNAKQTLKSFYEVPIDIIEDAEALTQWATEAVEK